MDLSKMSKRTAKLQLESILEKTEPLSKDDEYFLCQILYYVERQVIEGIRARQTKVQGLKISGHGCVAVWGGDLTPGCNACLEGTGLRAIRATTRCNLSCDFCYYRGVSDPDLLSDHFKIANRRGYLSETDIKIIIDKQGKELSGIAWVSREPLMDLQKHVGLIKYIHEQGIHQWMYTNGTLLTEDTLRILSDSGLDELRFNLAATHCSPTVIEIMKRARKYFKYLCVESPMTPEFFRELHKRRQEILDTGLDQINCAELHLNANNISFCKNEPLYCFKYGYISPVSSRHATYDLIELAEKEGWRNVTINDCSNEAKFYRGVRRDLSFGEVDYRPEFALRASWYVDALERYEICQAVSILTLNDHF